MLQPPAASRERVAAILNAAYGDGLLSEKTLVYRLDVLFTSRLIDPSRLVGDLTIRGSRRAWSNAVARVVAASRQLWVRSGLAQPNPPIMLALDWDGKPDELLIGRHPSCDIVLREPTVSRRHARLRFRDGTWILQDLDSTNGTTINNVRVGRCELRPGDRLAVGDQHLLVD